MEIATYLAVITFNSGKEALQNVLEELHLPCGSTTQSYFQEQDKERIWHADHKGKELVKKRRRQMQLTTEEQLAAEGVQCTRRILNQQSTRANFSPSPHY